MHGAQPKKKEKIMTTNSSSATVSKRKITVRAISAVLSVVIAYSATVTVFGYGANREMTASETDGGKPFSLVSLFNRTKKVTIYSDGQVTEARVHAGTVKDAIKESGVELGKNDKVTPSKDTDISEVDVIKIKRVDYKYRTVTENLGFDCEIITDSSMPAGESKVVKKGVDGKAKITYKDKYVEGKLADSELVKEKVVKKPVNEVKKVGAKKSIYLKDYAGTGIPMSKLDAPASLKLDKNGVPKNYKKCINGKATAYCDGTICSTGRPAMMGHIAVDPKKIPYGSELYITSADGQYIYGYAIAADTGGFVKMGNTDIDLFMDDRQMCYDWGNRGVKIYVLS